MIRGLVLATALTASLLAPAHAERSPFSNGSGIGGGVVDLDTGETFDPHEDDEGFRNEPATVVPYRRGARIRIPVTLVLADGAGSVEVTGIRLYSPEGSVARGLGAVLAPGCCALHKEVPFTNVTLTERDSVAMVGVDVELCCATPEPGWLERLPGLVVTYRQHGLIRTAHHPFHSIQNVVVSG